jgi:hypothetical protein
MKANMWPSILTLVLVVLFKPALHSQAPVLPASISPNDVEIRMTRESGGGCPEPRCVHYRVTISGDGTVRYEDLATPPVPQRSRKVAVDEVVALANEFVRARFLEAPRRYAGKNFYVLQNGQLVLHASGAIDLPTWDLSFRLGTLQNSVHLEHEIPNYLGRLIDLVDKLGGPDAWTAR